MKESSLQGSLGRIVKKEPPSSFTNSRLPNCTPGHRKPTFPSVAQSWVWPRGQRMCEQEVTMCRLFILHLKRRGRGCHPLSCRPAPGCNAALMTAIPGQWDNKGSILRESDSREGPRTPTDFQSKVTPLDGTFISVRLK